MSHALCVEWPRERVVTNSRTVSASPGGWSFFLSQYVEHVWALDPAKIQIPEHITNVTHLKMMSTVAVPVLAEEAPFHLVVCDVNADARQAWDDYKLK